MSKNTYPDGMEKIVDGRKIIRADRPECDNGWAYMYEDEAEELGYSEYKSSKVTVPAVTTDNGGNVTVGNVSGNATGNVSTGWNTGA